MKELVISTHKKEQVIDITDQINDFLSGKNGQGHINVFVTHTTAAITIADLDPGTDLDMLDAFRAMIPPHQSKARYGAGQIKYRHPHDPAHVPDHILSALIGASVTLPYNQKGLILGQWQRVVLFEFDGPRERTVILSII